MKKKIKIVLGLNNMSIYHNAKKLKHKRDVYDFLNKYLKDIGGYDNFIFVGQETTIDLPIWLEIKEDTIELIKLA